ncbi:hypothetical protein [Lacticaseibacillus zeae]|nr:hypothetical protein [Lacticaseibacillus zeae]
MGLERGGHDFEPAKTAVSKLGLGLKRENHPFKTNFTTEPHLAYDCSALALQKFCADLYISIENHVAVTVTVHNRLKAKRFRKDDDNLISPEPFFCMHSHTIKLS